MLRFQLYCLGIVRDGLVIQSDFIIGKPAAIVEISLFRFQLYCFGIIRNGFFILSYFIKSKPPAIIKISLLRRQPYCLGIVRDGFGTLPFLLSAGFWLMEVSVSRAQHGQTKKNNKIRTDMRILINTWIMTSFRNKRYQDYKFSFSSA